MDSESSSHLLPFNSNSYDHFQTYFLQLSSLEKLNSPSTWEWRHVRLRWWISGFTTPLWSSNLLNTHHQIFGVKSSRSTNSLPSTLLSHRGSHCHHRWSLHHPWHLARVGDYVQPSFESPWIKTQEWLVTDETQHQTCFWICSYLQNNLWPSFMSLADLSRTLIKCIGSFVDFTLIFQSFLHLNDS